MTKPPASLRQFQSAFSQRLRDPECATALPDVPTRQGALYETLLFNNLCGFIDRCFPVSKQRMDIQSWRNLCRRFYRSHSCKSPYFREIPFQFLTYIQEATTDLPAWLPELLHYEWVELAVTTDPTRLPAKQQTTSNTAELKINPTLRNLQYHWPVHRLSADTEKDEIPAPNDVTCLLVYRKRDHKVQFMQIDPLTACLLQLLTACPRRPEQLADALHQLFPTISRKQLAARTETQLLGLLREQVLFTACHPAAEEQPVDGEPRIRPPTSP